MPRFPQMFSYLGNLCLRLWSKMRNKKLTLNTELGAMEGGQGKSPWGCFANMQINAQICKSMLLVPPSLHPGPVSTVFFLFVSVGVKATGKGALSDLPQKSDHSLSSPYSTFLPGAQWPAGDPLHALCPVCPVCPVCPAL